jgi:hypothetical protein
MARPTARRYKNSVSSVSNTASGIAPSKIDNAAPSQAIAHSGASSTVVSLFWVLETA